MASDLEARSQARDAAAQELRSVVYEGKVARGLARVPEKLFHFTDGTGVLGILRSQVLRMTPDDLQRDHLELEYGSLLLDAVRQNVDGLANLELGDMNPFAGNPPHRWMDGVYVTSFCTKGDIPHHWQNFGDGGRGYAIGIDFPRKLDGWSIDTEHDRPMFLRPVFYRERDQRRILESLLERGAELGANDKGSPEHRALRQVMGEVLPSFKHCSFRTEDEWRMFAIRSSGRPPKGALIMETPGNIRASLQARYRDLPLPIDCIIAGPRAPSESRAALERELEDCGYDSGVVLRSTWGPDRLHSPFSPKHLRDRGNCEQ